MAKNYIPRNRFAGKNHIESLRSALCLSSSSTRANWFRNAACGKRHFLRLSSSNDASTSGKKRPDVDHSLRRPPNCELRDDLVSGDSNILACRRHRVAPVLETAGATIGIRSEPSPCGSLMIEQQARQTAAGLSVARGAGLKRGTALSERQCSQKARCMLPRPRTQILAT
jgi:hypothetical protein